MTDSRIVLAVVVFLGLVALLGLGGLIWLVHSETDAAALALVAGPVGTTIGALGAVLASTRTIDPAKVADDARVGALADVASLSTTSTTTTTTSSEGSNAPAVAVAVAGGSGEQEPDSPVWP